MTTHVANHHQESGGKAKTLSAYLVGLILSLGLTVFAFALVEFHWAASELLYPLLISLALIQLAVQSICFLRLNASPEGRWNLLPFLFALFIVFIMVGGSLWIMYHLNYNMSH